MVVQSSITTTGTELLPMLRQKQASPTKARGRPAPDGSTLIKMDGSTWSSRTIWTGRQKIISGAANAPQVIDPIAIQIITAVRKQNSTAITTTEPSPT